MRLSPRKKSASSVRNAERRITARALEVSRAATINTRSGLLAGKQEISWAALNGIQLQGAAAQ